MMNKNRILLVSLIVGGVAFASCSMGSKGNKGEVLPKAEEKQALAGADKDEHGCILSAGYCWSEALKDCVRLWEAGVRMDVMKDGKVDKDATSSGFLVFAKDSLKVELFEPQSNGKPALLDRRKLPTGEYVWNVEDDDTPNVRRSDGKWTVMRRGKLIYASAD